MAAPQWTGTNAKAKSAQTAKALFRHNDEQRRAEVQHSNPHIDKSKTHLNFSYRGLTYEQRCAAYDARMGEIDQGKGGSGKNARTVLQSVILYPPAALAEDSAREKAWFLRAGELAEARFGKNLIDIAYDLDERHEYRDKDGKLQMSLDHGHMWLVPEVGGRLNGKQFSSRKNIMAFNAELQEMSIREFGCPMMDGSKAKGGKPVEQLKAESAAREIKAQAEAQAAEILSQAQIQAQGIKARAAAEAEQERKRVEQQLEARERAVETRERAVRVREANIPAIAAKAAREAADTEIEAAARERRKPSAQTVQKQTQAATIAAATEKAENVKPQQPGGKTLQRD